MSLSGAVNDELFDRLRVPDGINQIVWILAQEILRAQPDDIIAFAAKFSEDLHLAKGRIAVGDRKVLFNEVVPNVGTKGHKAPEVNKVPAAAPTESKQAAAEDNEEVDIDLKDPEVQNAAKLIQNQFRKFKEK